MEKLTLNELSANKNWKKAVIVFKQESFDKDIHWNQEAMLSLLMKTIFKAIKFPILYMEIA